MKKLVVKNLAFLVPYTIVFSVCFVTVCLEEKGPLHRTMNAWNHPTLDLIFPWITKLGEALPLIVLAILGLYLSWRVFLASATSYLFGGLIVLFGKLVLFDHYPRPSKYFGDDAALHWVEGVVLRSNNSFPSGHTHAGFTVFFCLALLLPGKWSKFLCFLIACLVGYSRIYISQHFLMDVVAGSAIAILTCLLWFAFWQRKDYPWLDKRLLSFIPLPGNYTDTDLKK